MPPSHTTATFLTINAIGNFILAKGLNLNAKEYYVTLAAGWDRRYLSQAMIHSSPNLIKSAK
jgi:hypothetical protein